MQQPFVGGVDLVGVGGVHRVAERLERHHERVALGVVDVEVTGVVGVAQHLPALFLHHGRVDVLVVVDETDAAPEVGNGPLVIGVVAHAAHRVVHVLKVWKQAVIERLEIILLHQAFDHVVRGNDHVVLVARHELGVHHLIGVEILHDDAHAELLFKVADDVLTEVLAGEIKLEDVAAVLFDGGSVLVLLRKADADRSAENGEHQHAGDSGHQPAALCKGFSLFTSFFFTLFVQDRDKVDDAEHQRDGDNDERGECVDGGIDALGHGVDQNGNVIHAVARGEVGDHEVVKAHGERDERAGDDARADLRHDDAGERLERRSAEVHRRVDEIRVERAQLRCDGEHDVGDAEHDVREQQRQKALLHRQHAEEHQQADAGDNIGIHHGQVVHALDHRLKDLLRL